MSLPILERYGSLGVVAFHLRLGVILWDAFGRTLITRACV